MTYGAGMCVMPSCRSAAGWLRWGTRKSTWEERLREDAEGVGGRRRAFHYRSSRCCSSHGARYCDTHGRIKHTGGGDYLDWIFFCLPLFDGRWWSRLGIVRRIQVGVCTKLQENCCPRKGQQLPLLSDRLRAPVFLAVYSESNNTHHAEQQCRRRSWRRRTGHFLNEVAGAIFKVVGDVCTAKNLCVADEHVTSQRKGLRNEQGSLYCVIRWMYFGNVAGCDRGRNINTKLAASFLWNVTFWISNIFPVHDYVLLPFSSHGEKSLVKQ